MPVSPWYAMPGVLWGTSPFFVVNEKGEVSSLRGIMSEVGAGGGRSASSLQLPIDPKKIPSDHPYIPIKIQEFRDDDIPKLRIHSSIAHASLTSFDARSKSLLFGALVNYYLLNGYSEDTAVSMAIRRITSKEAEDLFHYINTYDNLSVSYITSYDTVDLSYSFHSSKLPVFSDYTIGVFPWTSFSTDDITPLPSSAFSPFVVDPAIYNMYSCQVSDYIVIGSIVRPYVFLVNSDTLSVVDVARVRGSSTISAWSINSNQAIVLGTQAEPNYYELVVNPERKNYGTRALLVSINGNSFGAATTYIFPASSLVGFDVVDGKVYAATSFYKGGIQYTSIIDTSTREIIIREELHLPTFLGIDPSTTRVSLFTGVKFFKHRNHVVAGILHSHTICTGETKNLVTLCRYDSSVSSLTTEYATYYSCRLRSSTLPDSYFSIIPVGGVKISDDTTKFLMLGYDAEDLANA